MTRETLQTMTLVAIAEWLDTDPKVYKTILSAVAGKLVLARHEAGVSVEDCKPRFMGDQHVTVRAIEKGNFAHLGADACAAIFRYYAQLP